MNLLDYSDTIPQRSTKPLSAKLIRASFIVGVLGVAISILFPLEVLESLRFQLYAYFLLFLIGAVLGSLALFFLQGRSWGRLLLATAAIALNVLSGICICFGFLERIRECHRRGWM